MRNKLELIGVVAGILLLGVTVIAVMTLVIRTVWFWWNMKSLTKRELEKYVLVDAITGKRLDTKVYRRTVGEVGMFNYAYSLNGSNSKLVKAWLFIKTEVFYLHNEQRN